MSESDESLLEKLKSSNIEYVYGALLKIRKTYVKDPVKRKKILHGTVIRTLLSLIEHPKFSNISLSIIADGCLDKDVLLEVLKYDGVKSLMRIMKSLLNDDIQNRACRALGNIAKSSEGFKAVHIMKPIFTIVKFLNGTQDVNCQQTAVRTLRILGKNSKFRDVLVRENGIICIAKLLHSSEKGVLLSSTRALAELTMNCNMGCARQLLEMQSLKMLVELNHHAEKSIKMNALTSLKNISSQDETRSDLIKAGALKLFTEVTGKCGPPELRRLAALALCNCLNYLHMWDNYGVSRSSGLAALLGVLRSKEMEDIHVYIVTSLLPLCYEQATADVLLDLEVIQILSKLLKKFVATNKVENHLPLLQTESLKSVNDFPTPKVKTNDSVSCCTSERQSSSPYSSSLLDSPFSTFDLPSPPCAKGNSFNFPAKNFSKFDVSSCFTYHSSGASSQYSPSSSASNSAMSPRGFSDYNPGSPIEGPWSPCSTNEDPPLCYSPVLSCSDSSDFEIEKPEPIFTKDSCMKTLFVTEDTDGPQSKKDPVQSHLGNEFDDQIKPNVLNPPHLDKDVFSTTESSDPVQTVVKKHKLEKLTLSLSEGCAKKHKSSSLSSNQELTDASSSEICVIEKYSIDYYILSILMQFSYLEKKGCNEYASSIFLLTLLDYLTLLQNPNPKAEKFLIIIIKNRHTFDKLIKSGFILEFEAKLTPQHSVDACKRCSFFDGVQKNLLSTLRREAESDYGVGTLCHILSTCDKSSQIHALYFSTKLISLKAALFRVIVQAKGLSLLIDFLSEDLSLTAIISLCQLFQNLTKSSLDAGDQTCVSSTPVSPSKCAFKDVPTDVTFIVDGISVSACRETICCSSDYFSALLDGHFLESHMDEITLCDISAETLTTIFHFLHGCNTFHSSCPYIKRIPFSILLELLHQSEKFLLKDVKIFVVDSLCHNLFHNTVSKIYVAAKRYNCPDLLKKTLSFVLSTDLSKKDTLHSCFKDLMGLENCHEFLTDIHSFIEEVFSEYILKNVEE